MMKYAVGSGWLPTRQTRVLAVSHKNSTAVQPTPGRCPAWVLKDEQSKVIVRHTSMRIKQTAAQLLRV